ncbi:hypothetical protein D3C85_1375870 [compost metagenome]
MPADKLLPRLDKARQVKPGKWIARCPAHDDKTPSAHITEAEDGKLLVECWAGCSAAEIVMSALTPQRCDVPHSPLGLLDRKSQG